MRNGGKEFRALNVPEKIQVELDNGRPGKVVKSRRARVVESVLECWRIDDEWWRKPITRTYYEVVLETGGRVVLFQDLTTNEWWMQS
jgi:hypothetical protein